jgi:hypothetical protein
MTATIFARMLNLPKFKNVEDLHVNLDGAGDNINYTFLYSLVHLLLCAKKSGWALKRIHLHRMKVGHTHNELDATFAILSLYVYGKHSRGDPRQNILSPSDFKKVSTHHSHTIHHTPHSHPIHTHTHTHTHTL